MHQLIGQQWLVVQHLLHRLDRRRVRGPIIMHADDYAHQSLPAEGNQNARADRGHGLVYRVGEAAVERHRQRNVAEVRHRI